MLPFPGGQLGSYRLVSRIGGGGMGEVYLAEDKRMGFTRQVAIKMIRAESDIYPDQAANQDAERLFRREMQVIATLDHPFILPLYDFGEERVGDTFLTYMVMPFRPEGSLANWLQKHTATRFLSLEETAHFVEQAAQALQHAHDHNLIHQDVKPANFLIRNRSGQVLPDILLSDFGIVKIVTATTTASQSIRGTPSYMAPEQWNGLPVAATDQYALAIMTYVLLTKQHPFKGSSMQQVMHQHLNEQPQAPSTFNPAIPPDLDTVIFHALQKEPKDRFASISAFANALKQAIRPGESGPLPVLKVSPDDASSLSIPLTKVLPVEVFDVSHSASTLYTGSAMSTPIPPEVAIPSTLPSVRNTPLPAFAESKLQMERETTRPLTSTRLTRPKPRVIIALGVLVLLILASTISGLTIHQKQVIAISETATAITENAQATTAEIAVQATATAIAAQATEFARETATATANPCPQYIQQCGSFSILHGIFDTFQGSAGDFGTGIDTDYGGSCQYNNNTFTVSQSKTGRFYVCTEKRPFNNFVAEVQVEDIQGNCGGMMIEYNPKTSEGYLLTVCRSSSNGVQYKITKYIDSQGAHATTLKQGSVSSISLSGTHTFGVAAINGSITLYADQYELLSVSDNSFASGLISLVADAQTDSTTVTYVSVSVWA
jgi:eukaryotic-like serine/threonine-protein kinase